MRLLFIHGAGGFGDDRTMAAELAASLRAELIFPQLPDDDMSLATWMSIIREPLAFLEPDDALVGHSFGATVVVHALAESPGWSGPTALLAAPDWSPRGWDVPECDCSAPPPPAATLFHCRDDEIVPFEHLGLQRSRWDVDGVAISTGGHQFTGQLASVAERLRGH